MRFALKIVFFLQVVAAVHAGTPLTSLRVHGQHVLAESATGNVPYPLVVRIDRSVFDVAMTRHIDRISRVNKIVLGSHVVGRCHTHGVVSAVLLPDPHKATFTLRFEGTVHSKTVGANGPVLIDGHTDTKFVCTRSITLNESHRFVAGSSAVSSETKLVYDGVRSRHRGVGHRIITRVASQRANRSHPQAERIAASDIRTELLAAFDAQVDAQLVSINRKLDVLAAVNRWTGDGAVRQIAVQTSPDCIYLGLKRDGNTVPLMMPGAHSNHCASVEMWLHPFFLAQSVSCLMSIVEGSNDLPRAALRRWIDSVPFQSLAGNRTAE